MSKQQIMNVLEVEELDTCVNYTCRHTLNEHNNRNHKSKCQCRTFKTAGGPIKK